MATSEVLGIYFDLDPLIMSVFTIIALIIVL